MHFGIKFEFSACIALALLFAINAIQAIGDLTATTVGDVYKRQIFSTAETAKKPSGITELPIARRKEAK